MKNLLVSVALAALAFPTVAQTQAPVASKAATAPSAGLQSVFKASDEADLKRNPISALIRGDMRYADQFPDMFSDKSHERAKADAQADLKALDAIDRASLSPDEQISYDIFRWNTETGLKGLSPEVWAVARYLPVDHFNGLNQQVPDLFSGQSVVRYTSVKDYEDNLKRLDRFAQEMDAATKRMQEGVAAGIVQPRIVSQRVLEQLELMVKTGVEKSPLMMPVQQFPDTVPEAERKRLTAAYHAKVQDVVLPSYARMRDFVRDTYLPKSRSDDKPGLVGLPGGSALYDYLVTTNTTTKMTAEEVHQLGLSEVARIHGEMDAIMKQVGFKGDRAAFFTYLRSDPKFRPPSRQWLTDGYYAIGKKVDANVGKLFGTLPRTQLEIKPYPAYIEKDAAGGSYWQGSADGKRPGIFHFNAYDLASRPTWAMETLYLHEGAPGHHFQISLAQENEKLPNFQRFNMQTAYVEGWGLYAESLGRDLGMFTDPYQYFGRLNDEMLRAMRLVVDTGLHAKGWSRQQAIDYMVTNSAMSVHEATNEVDRYIAMPGQALGYKVGDIRFQQAKARAQKVLGDKFDIKRFHDQLLMSGSMPMEIMDQKIDRWIAAGGK